VAHSGSTAHHPADTRGVGALPAPAIEGEPTSAEMISTGEAATIIGKDPRTIERWVDARKLRGSRPRDPVTDQPLKGSHRWVDARHAVAVAVGAGRTHLVPEQWRYLIPQRSQERLHLVEGLLTALVDAGQVAQVAALIRSCDDAAAAKAALIAQFGLTDVQAAYILDTPLRRLTRFDRLELEAEQGRLRAEIAALARILDGEAVTPR